MGESKVRVNRRLNIVFPIDCEDGSTVHVHSVPVSMAVFESNFLVMARAYTQIYSNGLGPVTGPRVSGMLLRQEAKELGILDKVESGLIQEIYRLTNVAYVGEKGWETLPLREASRRGVIGTDDTSAIENCIIFFTLTSSIGQKTERNLAIEGLHALWGAETTYSNITEYMRGLPTLTQEGSTGETEMAVQPLMKA